MNSNYVRDTFLWQGVLDVSKRRKSKSVKYTMAAVICALCLFLSAPVRGQEQKATPALGVVKGAEHPELIPDREAFRSLFNMLADRPNKPPTWEFRYTILAPAGLTKEEQTIVVEAANIYGAKAAATTRAIQALRNVTPSKTIKEVPDAKIDALMVAQGAALDQIIKDLQDELKLPSYDALLKFIRTTWKRGMNYYPGVKVQ